MTKQDHHSCFWSPFPSCWGKKSVDEVSGDEVMGQSRSVSWSPSPSTIVADGKDQKIVAPSAVDKTTTHSRWKKLWFLGGGQGATVPDLAPAAVAADGDPSDSTWSEDNDDDLDDDDGASFRYYEDDVMVAIHQSFQDPSKFLLQLANIFFSMVAAGNMLGVVFKKNNPNATRQKSKPLSKNDDEDSSIPVIPTL